MLNLDKLAQTAARKQQTTPEGSVGGSNGWLPGHPSHRIQLQVSCCLSRLPQEHAMRMLSKLNAASADSAAMQQP